MLDAYMWKECIKIKTENPTKVFYCKNCCQLAISTKGIIEFSSEQKKYTLQTSDVTQTLTKDLVLVSTFQTINCILCEKLLGSIAGQTITFPKPNVKLVMFNNDSTRILFEVN